MSVPGLGASRSLINATMFDMLTELKDFYTEEAPKRPGYQQDTYRKVAEKAGQLATYSREATKNEDVMSKALNTLEEVINVLPEGETTKAAGAAALSKADAWLAHYDRQYTPSITRSRP